MAFESLTERLSGVFKKLRGKGKLGEADIKAAMREVRMALLEAVKPLQTNCPPRSARASPGRRKARAWASVPAKTKRPSSTTKAWARSGPPV